MTEYDDVPDITYIFYSTKHAYFYLFALLFIVIVCCFLIDDNINTNISLIISIPFLIGIALLTFKMLSTKKPQIIINALGIEVVSKGFLPWNQITTIFISENSESTSLEYIHLKGCESIDLSMYTIEEQYLKYAIKVYLSRYEKNNPTP